MVLNYSTVVEVYFYRRKWFGLWDRNIEIHEVNSGDRVRGRKGHRVTGTFAGKIE
jgi:hypothetical protein